MLPCKSVDRPTAKPGQIVARCNCDQALAEEVVAKRKTNWDVYNDYRWLLDRKSRWV